MKEKSRDASNSSIIIRASKLKKIIQLGPFFEASAIDSDVVIWSKKKEPQMAISFSSRSARFSHISHFIRLFLLI
jgi:hypothetical protein